MKSAYLGSMHLRTASHTFDIPFLFLQKEKEKKMKAKFPVIFTI
jgi:hypothetical protein